MHLCGVHVTLDNVEDGDVLARQAVLRLGVSRDHDVLGLQQPPHDVQHRRLPDLIRGLQAKNVKVIYRYVSLNWTGREYVKCPVYREPQLVGAQFSRRAGIRRPKLIQRRVFRNNVVRYGETYLYNGCTSLCEFRGCVSHDNTVYLLSYIICYIAYRNAGQIEVSEQDSFWFSVIHCLKALQEQMHDVQHRRLPDLI